MPPCDAVLFDLDGVLVDSYEVWFHLMNQAADAFGRPAISRAIFHGCWGQGVAQDQARFYPDQDIPTIEAFFDAHFMEHASVLSVDPDTSRVFAELARQGIRTAVVTNTPNPLATAVVARTGAVPDTIVGGTDVPASKPAPDMVFEACRRLAVSPERAWMVGDSHYDRDAARAAGVRFVGVAGIEGDPTLESVGRLLDYV